MARRRSYGDACGVARALDLLGERWALMIVRELLLGPKRFTDIRRALPALSPDVLAQRLRELEGGGVLTRRRLPPPAASQIYELTERGTELEPVVMGLGRWGSRLPPAPPETGMSLDSHVLMLRTLFDAERARGLTASFELRLGEAPFRVELDDGRFAIAPGEAVAPDAAIETEPATLVALVHGQRELADALEAGEARIEGDRAAVERFLTLFPLPEPVLA